MDNLERCLNWDDTIQNDSPDFILLEEGDYDFEVMAFERARHAGSEKLPPCNKAVISIKISVPQGDAIIKHNLFLHTKTEGMLCAFFTSIGQRKHGEALRMDWNKVIGAKGRCKVSQRKWINSEEKELTGNDIKKFHEPEDYKENQESLPWAPGKF